MGDFFAINNWAQAYKHLRHPHTRITTAKQTIGGDFKGKKPEVPTKRAKQPVLLEAWSSAGRNILDVRHLRANPDARRKVRRFDLNELRNHLLANINRVRTTRVERTARRRIDRRRDVAFQHDA